MNWIRIINVTLKDQLTLNLTFNDGTQGTFDFSKVADGGVLKKLLDADFFTKFEIVRSGRALAWPDGIDFCTDELHMQLKK